MSAPHRLLSSGDLVSELKRVSKLPEELIDVLRSARLSLRDDPTKRSEYGHSTFFWTALSQTWQDQSSLLLSVKEGLNQSREAITSLAYFLAGLCTNHRSNQTEASVHIEPHLRRILISASSLTNLEDPDYTNMTKACVQALANLITNNPELSTEFLKSRLGFEKEDKLIARLFASKDHSTLEALLIFLLNSIHSSPERAQMLATYEAGPAILDRMLILVDTMTTEEEADPQIASRNEGVFKLAYSIGQQLIENGAWIGAYRSQMSMPGFIISSAQMTLLKFLDGYLSSLITDSKPLPTILDLPSHLSVLLGELSMDLINDSRPKDGRDANTFQGVVLVITSLNSIGLQSAEGRNILYDAVDPTIALLQYASNLSSQPSTLKISTVDEPSPWTNSPALGQLKRECVKLLSISGSENKRTQDRIREKGGLLLILGMCQIDDSNPTLREHALFAIRNLLKNNEENQAVVASLEPKYIVGRNGELKDLPPALRPDGHSRS